MKYFALNLRLIFILLLTSCSASKNSLFNKYEASYSNHYRILTPDKQAIKHNRDDGVYTVTITNQYPMNTLCYADTSTIKTWAVKEAKTIKRIMNHKENYQYIDVTFDAATQKYYPKNAEEEEISCSYTTRVLLPDLSITLIRNSNNNVDATNLYRVRTKRNQK